MKWKENKEREHVLCNQESELEGFFFRYGLTSRALLKPLEVGYLSYYVIRLAGTSNESCGNLSALWMAPSTTTIYQLALHLPPPPSTHTRTHAHTHIHSRVIAKHYPSLDGLEEMDWASNGIPMLNTPPSVFCHLGWAHYSQPDCPEGTTLDYFKVFFSLSLHYHGASSMELSHNIYLKALDKRSDAVAAAAAVCCRQSFLSLWCLCFWSCSQFTLWQCLNAICTDVIGRWWPHKFGFVGSNSCFSKMEWHHQSCKGHTVCLKYSMKHST